MECVVQVQNLYNLPVPAPLYPGSPLLAASGGSRIDLAGSGWVVAGLPGIVLAKPRLDKFVAVILALWGFLLWICVC